MDWHICLLPGLGVDERIFKYLKLAPEIKQTVIHWIAPASNEKLDQYATRLVPQIPVTDNLILLGVSFGGMLAVEIAKLLKPALVIIISSIKTRQELPWYYKSTAYFRLAYLLPIQWGKYLYPVQDYIFGVKAKADKQLLHQIIQEMDMSFVRWALTQIAAWSNQTNIPNLMHLHGTHDKLFPIRYLHNFIPIQKGEHLMVVSQGSYISELINQKIYRL